MKVGKVPVAAIIVIVIVLTSLVLNKIYPSQYGFESPFVRGAFFGAILVYFLYYLNIWVSASANIRKEEAAEIE
jgi:1-acyl-sn-glycerol-3-phosphate acyltransferase